MKHTLKNFLQFTLSSKAIFFLFLEAGVGILLSVASLLFFIDIAEGILRKEGLFLDTAISQIIYSLRNPFLTNVMYVFTFLGSDILLLFSSLITIFLVLRKHKHEALLFIFVLGMTALVNIFLKSVIQRPRPTIDPLLTITNSYSFPSGHAMNSFVFYTLLAYFVYHFTKKKRLSTIISTFSLLLIALIGLSRVYLGVHYPTDVLGGYLAGFFIFITMLAMKRTIKFFRLYKIHKNAATHA